MGRMELEEVSSEAVPQSTTPQARDSATPQKQKRILSQLNQRRKVGFERTISGAALASADIFSRPLQTLCWISLDSCLTVH